MNKWLLLVLMALPFQMALSAEPSASDASVRELMRLSQQDKMMDGFMKQMEGAIRKGMSQATANNPPNAEQQKIMDATATKMADLMREAVGWETMAPRVMELYVKTFTQSEIDGLLAFYRSKSGQAMVAKMPQIMQASMQLGQERAATLLPKLQQLMKDTAEQIKAAATPAVPAAPTAPTVQ